MTMNTIAEGGTSSEERGMSTEELVNLEGGKRGAIHEEKSGMKGWFCYMSSFAFINVVYSIQGHDGAKKE